MNQGLMKRRLGRPTSLPEPPDPGIGAVVLLDEVLENVPDDSVFGLAELILKNPPRLERLVREEARQRVLIPRLLAIALASFSLFSLALALLLKAAPLAAVQQVMRQAWSGNPAGPALNLWLAYTLGLVAATGVCLPSFYFYALLAGVRVSVLQVTAQIMKGKATTAVMLMGILPIYVAWVLGLIVFNAADLTVEAALDVGLILPFLAGLWGVRSVYLGFLGLADTLPADRRCKRECFLRRLTVACAACYSAVTPVMIYTLWDYFTRTCLISPSSPRGAMRGLVIGAITMGLLGPTLVLYLVIGIGVAGAVYLLPGEGTGPEQWFRVATSFLFWPLYLPILLGPRSQSREASRLEMTPPAPKDEMTAAIAQVDAELEAALASLDGWAEGVLTRERDRIHELRTAWTHQAQRIREMDQLLTLPEFVEEQETETAAQLLPLCDQANPGERPAP